MSEAAATAEAAAEEEKQGGVKIGDKLYTSPEDFTIGEAEIIKANVGLTPQDLIMGVREDPTDPTFLRAIAWVILSRESGKTVEWDDKRITESSIGMFFVVPDEEPSANPPGSRQKRSSSARRTT